MKNYIVLAVLLLNGIILYAQLDKNSVMGIPSGTTDEIEAVTPYEEGAIVFNNETKKLMIYDGTTWVDTSIATTIVSANDDNQIEEGTDGGAYLGSTVYVGAFQITGTGNKVITGLKFKPSQITFVAHANIEDFNGIDGDNGVDIPSGNNDKGNNNGGIANSFGTMNGFAREDGGTTPAQQVIYVGGSGNSINDISRYASNTDCIGLRYSNQNGDSLGKTIGSCSFDSNGFTINVTSYAEKVIVMYTAYK